MSESDLKLLKIVDLKDIIRKNKLGALSGNKAVLIKRIVDSGVDIKMTQSKTSGSNNNKTTVNVFLNGSKTPSLVTNIPTGSTVDVPITVPSTDKARKLVIDPSKPAKKFKPIKTDPSNPQAPISAKVQKSKDIISEELKSLPKSKVTADFKKNLESLFGSRGSGLKQPKTKGKKKKIKS